MKHAKSVPISQKWFSNDVMLSFIVLFSKPNPTDCLRIYHKDQLVDEIVCDSRFKKIDISISYQSDLQFLMVSGKNSNVCEFFFVTINAPGSSSNKFGHFLYTKSRWGLSESFQHDLEYHISLFGTQIHGQIARPDFKNKVCWKSNITLKNTDSDKYWHDDICNETFVKLTGIGIAKFKPGYMCFFMNPNSGVFHINIFKNINMDLDSNLLHLTKTTGKISTIAIDRLWKLKKIHNEKEYLNFISDCLSIWPALKLGGLS